MKKVFIILAFLVPLLSYSQINQFVFTGLTALGPTTIDGQTNVVINAMQLGNTSQSTLSGKAIRIINCTNVTITNCYISASWNRAIELEDCINVNINNNFFGNVGAGVYARHCTNIKVNYNQFINCHIWTEKGQYVQYNDVYGTGNEIIGNRGESWYGESDPEDLISIHASNGTSGSRILISNNIFRGGGPSNSGGGIMLGDGGGSYATAQSNKLVDVGQYGIAISGGDYNILDGNEVYCVQKPWTNIGWYVANYSALPTCSNQQVINNKVNYTNAGGSSNNAYNSGDCGSIVETGNTYDQSLASMAVPSYLFNISENEHWRVRDDAAVFASQINISRPTANAGSDQSVSATTTTLSGSGGTTYQWVQVSGPNTATIAASTSASTSISGLVNGVYEFRLQVYGTTDGQQVADADWVQVTASLSVGNFQSRPTIKRKIRIVSRN